jgi:DNA ligase-1
MDVLLAKKWDGKQDAAGWWMSEKLDGVRGYWDGTRMASRNGHEFAVPKWFLATLPRDLHLDGELWGGRGNFDTTSGIVRSQSFGERWKQLVFVVFDVPSVAAPFEERMAVGIERLHAKECRATWLAHRCLAGNDELVDALAAVQRLGGEGLMLRQPRSAYERRRSSTLLKVKTFLDGDAVVIGHEPGLGKHDGRLGALVCLTADGVQFNVGTGFSDAQREAPPAVGATISYSYFELTKSGTPRFPAYLGTRADRSTP